MARSLLPLAALVALAACTDAGSTETVTLLGQTADSAAGCVLLVRDAAGASDERRATAEACDGAALLGGGPAVLTVDADDEGDLVTAVGPAPGVAGGATTP